MTESEKRCGLGSFIPMACRGRAEAFARRLHSRLRSLGSQDGGGGNGVGVDSSGGSIDNGSESENSWLTKNEVLSHTSITSIQPRQNASSATTAANSDLFMDFAVFETPGSPEEEITESDLSKLITNETDDLHLTSNLDECNCMRPGTIPASKHIVKRNSLDDGLYYDPENTDLETTCLMLMNSAQVNGFASPKQQPSEYPSSLSSSSDCNTISANELQPALSFSVKQGDNVETKPKPTMSHDDDTLGQQQIPPWKLNFEYKTSNNHNNNSFSAIDLESLKSGNVSNNCVNGIAANSDAESYCSHFDLEQNFTVECPTNFGSDILSVPEISTFEIRDLDEIETEPKIETKELNVRASESTSSNSLQNGQETQSETAVAASLNVDDRKTTSNYLQVQVKEEDADADAGDAEIEEERIPRVRRCSSLKTGKTPPGTPGRKKIVRFADVLGLDLADVRTFMDDIPKVPTSAYDDLSISSSDASLNSASSSLHATRPSKTLVPLFQQPGGETNFLDRVREQQVCLENAVLRDPIDMCLCGTVRVRNLDYNKSVHIRYSLDAWKSYADLQATYVNNSCDGFSDKFSFTLYVHTINIGQKLEFAVRFQCKGCQYWDNNTGQNYCFHCLPNCNNNNTANYLSGTPDDTQWAGAAFY